eukprot:XP_020404545.1 uncharacterized protein LOC109944255 [Zea mays]
MTVFDSPGGGEVGDSISLRQKRSSPVVPATLLAEGGGDGATMATREAAPYRLSHQSESTTPALPRGTCQWSCGDSDDEGDDSGDDCGEGDDDDDGSSEGDDDNGIGDNDNDGDGGSKGDGGDGGSKGDNDNGNGKASGIAPLV